MGWKGTLRSMNAASRRASAASERQRRAIASIENKAESTVRGLDAEIEREIHRIERHEERIANHPVKTLKLVVNAANEWEAAAFKEQTGKLTYTLHFTPPSISGAAFEPPAVDLDGVRITPRSLSVSQYFTAIAFEATATNEKGTTVKLTYSQRPEASRIALALPSGEIFNTLDTSLDGRLFGGTSRSGVVAFEPFDDGHPQFDILFETTPKGKNSISETLRIRVSSATLESDILTCLQHPSILEEMTKQFRDKQQDYKDRANAAVSEAKKKAAGGCMLVLVAWGATIMLGVVLAMWALPGG